MAITYDSSTETIKVGSGTYVSPVTFEDLYQADQAGGWGVVTKLPSGRAYEIDTHLDIVNGFLEGREIEVVFTKAEFVMRIYYRNSSGFRFGGVDANGKPAYGGMITVLDPASGGSLVPYNINRIGYVEIYDSVIDWDGDWLLRIASTANHIVLWKNRFKKFGRVSASGRPLHIEDNVFEQTSNGSVFSFANNPDRVVNNRVRSAPRALYCDTYAETQPFYIAGLIADGLTDGTYDITFRTSNEEREVHLLDCSFPRWTIEYILNRAGTKIYREYSFDPIILDQNGNPLFGVTVAVLDKDGNTLAEDSTNVEGRLGNGPARVAYGYYQAGSGFNPLSPHQIHIYKLAEIDYTLPLTVDRPLFDQKIILDPHNNALTLDELPNVIADAVWDELLADHQTAGSMGKAQNDAASGSGGTTPADVWNYADRTLTGPVDVDRVHGAPVTGPDDLKADVSFLEAVAGGTWKIEDDGTGHAVQVFYDESGTEVLRVKLYRKDGQQASMAEFEDGSIMERRRS